MEERQNNATVRSYLPRQKPLQRTGIILIRRFPTDNSNPSKKDKFPFRNGKGLISLEC